MGVALSVLDLAEVDRGGSVADALQGSVDLAVLAERLGYTRVWYAEHHNMKRIASAATSVLIAHVAANTTRIRLGAGGVMLPNHSPLVIAEQFGTLAELHPGRIDLGLGRAPGTDQRTLQALRRPPAAAEHFPSDVLELQGYLDDDSRVPGIEAVPGKGTHVPIYILGSSMFGAQLAAKLGLPYGFASHFAPEALEPAVAAYRRHFEPSEQLAEPYVIAGINVIASTEAEDAAEQFVAAKRRRARLFFRRRGRPLSDEEVDAILSTPEGAPAVEMLRYSAVGTPAEVVDQLLGFAEHAHADELILASAANGRDARLRSFELIADAYGLARAA